MMARFIKVERSENTFRILKSEWAYLGAKAIEGKVTAKDGETILEFQSNDEESRLFQALILDGDWTYVEGDVIQDKKVVGAFILKKVPEGDELEQ